MPDEDNTDTQSKDPHLKAPVKSPEQNDTPTPHEERTYDLQKDIRDDQRWLKYMGAATIIMSVVIAWIYYNQLTQMRLATEASTRTAQLAADALDYNTGEFERNMRQLIHQTASQAASANASAETAKAAETANINALNSERPWMGATLEVQDFEVAKIPTFTVTFYNTGKSPAKVSLTQTLSVARDEGDHPQYRAYDTTPSISLVVPGQPDIASWKGDTDPLMNPISAGLIAALTSKAVPFRVYAKIEYSDMRTNAKYWTHVCWRYLPTMTQLNKGFVNCPNYIDAK
jgi:hypothetical protein